MVARRPTRRLHLRSVTSELPWIHEHARTLSYSVITWPRTHDPTTTWFSIAEFTRQRVFDRRSIFKTYIQPSRLHTTHMTHWTSRIAFASRLRVLRSGSAHMDSLSAQPQPPSPARKRWKMDSEGEELLE